MPVTALEKLAFALPVAVLYAQKRVALATLGFAGIDLVLGAMFLVAWRNPVAGPSDGTADRSTAS